MSYLDIAKRAWSASQLEPAGPLTSTSNEVVSLPAIDWQLDELPDWPAPPCKSCSSLELWEDALGRWRCLHCDPPEAARRFRQLAERIRKRRER